jgi:hypothetical protein
MYVSGSCTLELVLELGFGQCYLYMYVTRHSSHVLAYTGSWFDHMLHAVLKEDALVSYLLSNLIQCRALAGYRALPR